MVSYESGYISENYRKDTHKKYDPPMDCLDLMDHGHYSKGVQTRVTENPNNGQKAIDGYLDDYPLDPENGNLEDIRNSVFGSNSNYTTKQH